MANQIFKAQAQSVSGLKVACSSRGLGFVLDEPKMLGGTNEGMNPVEALLCSLGACEVIVARSFAKYHGIKLKDIRIDLEGVLDTDGFTGKNPNVKVGFSKIVSKVYIDADNSDEEIEKFVAFINKTCPVHDTLEHPAVLETEIHRL